MADVVVHAKSLLKFFDVLQVTMGRESEEEDGFSAVYLRTGKAVADGGVSPEQVLTGVSTTGVVVGRMLVRCNGDLPAPVLVPASALKWLMPVLREIAADDKEALVTLQVDAHSLSARVVVETMPGRVHVTTLVSAQSFPVQACENALDGSAARSVVTDKEDRELVSGALTALPGKYLKVLFEVSKRVEFADVRLYRVAHAASLHVVSVGPWRGALPAAIYDVDTDVDFPDDQPAL